MTFSPSTWLGNDGNIFNSVCKPNLSQQQIIICLIVNWQLNLCIQSPSDNFNCFYFFYFFSSPIKVTNGVFAWWRHLTTATRMLWGKLLHSCDTCTKIAAKCILLVVVKWRHHANVLFGGTLNDSKSPVTLLAPFFSFIFRLSVYHTTADRRGLPTSQCCTWVCRCSSRTKWMYHLSKFLIWKAGLQQE